MPFLQLKTIQGLLNDEQKAFLMEEFTKLLIQTEGGGDPSFRKMIWIQIDEKPPESWQIGEMRPNAEQISQFVSKRPANSA
jgi:4-oxalocrotonate tautomerase